MSLNIRISLSLFIRLCCTNEASKTESAHCQCNLKDDEFLQNRWLCRTLCKIESHSWSKKWMHHQGKELQRFNHKPNNFCSYKSLKNIILGYQLLLTIIPFVEPSSNKYFFLSIGRQADEMSVGRWSSNWFFCHNFALLCLFPHSDKEIIMRSSYALIGLLS